LKPCKQPLLFQYILFCELILLFSIFSAFSICHLINLVQENPENSISPDSQAAQRYWLKNYRLLSFFLNQKFPDHSDQKPEFPPVTAIEDLRNKMKDVPPSQPKILIDFLKLKYSEQLLNAKKFGEFKTIVQHPDSPYPFLNRQRNKLFLQYLYAAKKYPGFIKRFDTHPLNDTGTKIQYLNCLLKTGNTDRAFELFKTLFSQNKLSVFKDKISRPVLRMLINKLDHGFWVEKFTYLAKINNFREIFIEKKYVKSSQLISLFSAEYHYRKRRFKKAKNLLNKVNKKDLLAHKKKLIFKINLRTARSNFDEIIQHIHELKDHKQIYADLLFNAANIMLMKEKSKFALKLYNQFIISNLETDNPDFWKALWISAWIRLKKNQKTEALKYFNLGKNSPIVPYKVANSYWVYQMGESATVGIEKYPFSYYFTKLIDLKQRGMTHISLNNFIQLVNQNQNPILMDIIRGLKYLIKNHLVDESLQLIQLVKNENSLSRSDMNVIMIIESIIYLKKNDYYQAFKKFKDNFECYQCIQLPTFLSEIYLPVRFESLIKKYSQQNDLDPYLILSLIREESFFKADAVSTARAYGLMQILLGTAREVANKKIQRRDLFEPETNIRLGTKYLKRLINKYRGKTHLALAAYNAGDFRVDRWIEQFGHAPDDEFIEMIPITATRTYVKNIYRNYFYYKLYHRRHNGSE
jgi:soluble lytic murein transglycosylase